MNKKKKCVIGIIGCSIIILAIAGILIYIYFSPYIRLKKTADNLLNKQYEFEIDGKVEGMDLPLLGNSFQGKINGEKGKNVICGDISYKDSTYLKLYADKNGEIVFDAGPVIKAALNKVADNSIFGAALIRSISSDVKISYSQIEEVLNQNIITLNDEGVSNDLINKLAHGKNKEYSIKLLKSVDDKYRLLENDAYYFEIDLKSYNTKLVVGVPKDKNDTEVSFVVYTDKITWSFTGEYEFKDVEETEMPESTVSDKTISVLKSLYSAYQERKES